MATIAQQKQAAKLLAKYVDINDPKMDTLLNALEAVPHVEVYQGEGFDDLWVFDSDEAAELYRIMDDNDHAAVGEQVVCDFAFIESMATDKLAESSLGTYLSERGVDCSALAPEVSLELFYWWIDVEYRAIGGDWDTHQGPALDEKARTLLSAENRCENCGSDRGDGYCQDCPDDPDRLVPSGDPETMSVDIDHLEDS